MSLEKRKRRPRSQEELQSVARAYDVRRTNRFTKESINLFESVYRNYARILSNSLFLRFRVPMKLKLNQLYQTTYLNYVMNLSTNTLTTVYTMFPVKGPLCMTFDRQFAFLAIDAVLGGSFSNQAPDREFTEVEKGVLRIVSNAFIEPQEQCWHEYGRVDPAIRSVEFNPVLMQLCPEDESLLIMDFVLEANDVEYPVKIAIPYSSIENLPEVLQLVRHRDQELGAPTKESREQLDYHLKQTSVDCSTLLGRATLSVLQVNQLQVGDIVKLDRKVGEFLDMKVADQVHFKVQPGLAKNTMAVQVMEVVEPKTR